MKKAPMPMIPVRPWGGIWVPVCSDEEFEHHKQSKKLQELFEKSLYITTTNKTG